MKLLLITLTIIQSLFNTLEQKTLQADFNLTQSQAAMPNSQSQPMTFTGELAMRGKQFCITMFSMEAAYDGNNLYVYSEDTEELTISVPTQEELLQTNPFLYAQALLPLCEYTEKTAGDKTQITLTPRDQVQGIKKFTIRIYTKTLIPVTIEIYEADGKITTLRINNAQYKNECPSFILNKPEAFINDLR